MEKETADSNKNIRVKNIHKEKAMKGFGELSKSLVVSAMIVASGESIAADGDAVQTGNEAPQVVQVVESTIPVSSAAEKVEPDTDSSGKKKSFSRVIEEIIVTSEKREVNIQNVPLAISAFSAEKLDALGIKSAEELPKVTPGLTFSSSYGFTNVFMRGVGSNAFLPAADPLIPIYLDGVAMMGGQNNAATLGRIERVEVLKGPQGTLFGRNSAGGAISIITPDPTAEFLGDAVSEFGNYGTFNQSVYVSLPLHDSFGLSLAAYRQSQDTILENKSGGTINTYAKGVRAKAVWKPTSTISLNSSLVLSQTGSDTGLSLVNTRPGPLLSVNGTIVPADDDLEKRTVHHDTLGGAYGSLRVLTAGLTADLSAVEVKVIASDQQYTAEGFVDFDQSIMPLVSFSTPGQLYKQQSVELQMLSTSESPLSDYFSWVGGLYYLTGKGGFSPIDFYVAQTGFMNLVPGTQGLQNLLNGVVSLLPGQLSTIPVLTGPVTLTTAGELETDSFSGYFQGTTNLSEIFGLSRALNLVTGIRLDKEKRGLADVVTGVRNPLNNQSIPLLSFSVPEISAFQIPYKVALQWYPADEVQMYGSFSRGFTAPTYNTVNLLARPTALRAARVDSYELGVKSTLMDSSLTLNGAVFHMREHDILTGFVSLTTGGLVQFDNVPKAEISGAELDFMWQPMPESNPLLAVYGGVSYLHAEYTDYENGRGYEAATGLAFGPSAVLPARDFAGNRIDRTPKYSGNIGFNQAFSISEDVRAEIGGQMNFSGDYFYDPQNEPLYATKAFEIVDVTASVFYDPWQIQVSAFGNNIFDKTYVTTSVPNEFGLMQSANSPRLYGVRLKWSF